MRSTSHASRIAETSWVVPAQIAGGTQAKQERNKCCSLKSFESKWRICDIGEPFDTVKGINMSVGVFRRTEKQS